MNKLFTKVATLCVGLAMAAGVGVAVGANQKASSVEAGYEITTSIAVGDTVVFAYSNGETKKELKQISLFGSNYVGEVVDYTDSVPKAVYPLTVEAGTADGSFAFKDAENKYLVWESGNTLNRADAITANSSWKISDVSGVSLKLTNVKDANRKLQYNSGNPRFATYTSAQTAFSIFKYVEEGGDTYTIKYLPNGGDGKMSPTTSSHPLVGECEFTAPDGKRFASWNTQEDGKGDTYAVGTSVSKDISLYAIWEDIPEYTCAQAIAQIDASGDTKNVYVSGYVTDYETEVSGGKLSYWMADTADGGKVFEVYLGYGLDGKEFTSKDDLPLGSQIKIYCSLTKYKETYETVSGSKIVSLVAPEKELSSIAILGEMSKVEYYEGDAWNPEGLVVNATFDDQSVQDVSDKVEWSYNPASADSTKVKSVTVTASYTFKQIEKTDSVVVQVTVSEKPAAKDTYNLDGTKQVIAATRDGVTHYLKENGASNAPLSVATVEEATVFELTLVADDTFEFAVSDDSGKSYLYTTATNNGLRFGSGDAIQWKIEDGYQPTEGEARGGAYDIYATDSKGDSRYIALYEASGSFDWRVYKTPDAQNRLENIDLVEVGEPPVEDKYVVSFFEGTTESSSTEYVEGAKVTIPQPTESLIPEGKEFDYWSHKETGNHYAPGEEFTVGTSNARFDAVYKDVEPVVADWDPTLKTQFENELDGFVPPFVAAFSEAIEVYEGQNNAYGFVAENVVSDITSAFVNAKYGEPTEDEGAYSYSIPTANGTVQIEYAYSEGQSVGTYFYLIYVESITGEWSPEQQTQMTENVGLVLPYLGDDFAAALTLNDTDPEDVYFEGEVEGNKIMSIYTAFESAQWDYFWINPSNNNCFFTNPTGTGTAVFQCGAYQASATEIKTFFYYYFSVYRGIVELHESIDAYVGDSISDLELSLALVNTEMMGSLIDAANCEFSVTSFDTAGEIEVDVYYNYFYGSFTVNVIEVEATGLSLDASKVKSSYEIGEKFDPTGLEIKLNFNNGSSQDLSLDDVEISGFDSEVAGEKTITVKYGDFTQTFTVTVNEHVPVLESIQVTKNPDKVEYEVGEAFDSTGIEVSAIYDVGDPVVVDLKDVSFSGFDSATVGEKTVTVSYGDFSTTIKVTVKKAAYTAEQFAEDFLAEIEKVCKGYDGKKNNKTALNNVWTKMSARYNELSSEEKTKIANATPKADGDAIQRMLTFYNYACKKYGLTKFISTQKSSLVINSTETTNNNLPIIVIVASAIAAVTAIGVVIGLKRRKNLLVK